MCASTTSFGLKLDGGHRHIYVLFCANNGSMCSMLIYLTGRDARSVGVGWNEYKCARSGDISRRLKVGRRTRSSYALSALGLESLRLQSILLGSLDHNPRVIHGMMQLNAGSVYVHLFLTVVTFRSQSRHGRLQALMYKTFKPTGPFISSRGGCL